MADEFLDPLGRGGNLSNIPGGIYWLNLVVLVERADLYSVAVCVYGRMADEFLDPLGRGGKPSNIPGGTCWLNLVVLEERADLYSVAVCVSRFFFRGRSEELEARFVYRRSTSRRIMGVSHSGH